mgnify:CR=1 FL=1
MPTGGAALDVDRVVGRLVFEAGVLLVLVAATVVPMGVVVLLAFVDVCGATVVFVTAAVVFTALCMVLVLAFVEV